MEYTQPIIGHQRVQSYLRKQLKNGTVQHANLVVGPAHVGKRTLIANFVFEMMCPRTLIGDIDRASQAYTLLRKDSHPNVTVIEPLEEGKAIMLEQIQLPLSRLAWSRPLPGPRIVLIDQADAMSAGASNALLKTLEEPGTDIYFFLLAEQLDGVLPTIRSRCAAVLLYPVADSDLQSSCGLSAADIRVVQGLPGRAKQWQRDTERAEFQNQVKRWIAVLSGSTFARRQSSALNWLPKKLTRAYVQHQLDYIEHIIRDSMLLQLGVSDCMTYVFAKAELMQLQSAHSMAASVRSLLIVRTLRSYIQQPVQPKPILDQIYLQIYP